MKEVVISAEQRTLETKAKDLREEGKILGVIYGHDFESTPVKFDYQDFRKAYRETGDSTVLTLDVDGKKVATLVHEVQYNPVTDAFMHVDFLSVNESEPIKTHIPLALEGLSPAVKNLTAVLVTPLKTLEISCLPKYLQREIVVDVTGLENFHDAIHVSDLEISQNENITVLSDASSVVVTANPPKGYAHMQDGEESEEGVE